MCDEDGRRIPYMCANETSFNQKFRVCDWNYNVDCASSPDWWDIDCITRAEVPVLLRIICPQVLSQRPHLQNWPSQEHHWAVQRQEEEEPGQPQGGGETVGEGGRKGGRGRSDWLHRALLISVSRERHWVHRAYQPETVRSPELLLSAVCPVYICLFLFICYSLIIRLVYSFCKKDLKS